MNNGDTDDTAALQAILRSGPTVRIPPGIYTTTATIFVPGHLVAVDGSNALINFSGTGAAIDYDLVGTVYPQNCQISRLNISVTGSGGIGIAARTSHSTFTDVAVTLRSAATGGVGFDLPGDDEHGTGPYYNTFINCSVQGQGTGQVGVRLSNATERAANANTWMGGRVGQCATGVDICGSGNNFYGLAIEGCPAAVLFNNAVQCNLYGPYIEGATTGIEWTTATNGCGVMGLVATGVTTLFVDHGAGNFHLTGDRAARLGLGLTFGESTLKNYKEGTWTPTLIGETTPGTIVLSVLNATFERIGRRVFFDGNFTVSSISGSPAGDLRFGGLPYAKASASRFAGNASVGGVTLAATIRSLSLRESTSSTDTHFGIAGSRDGAGELFLKASDLSVGSKFTVSGSYITEAA